nr:glycosyltransferase family 39 protein [Anaerolineae bacterium]
NALLIWGVLIVALTEGLSLFRALTPAAPTIIWALLAIGLTIILIRRRVPFKATLRALVPQLDIISAPIVIGCMIIVIVTFGTLLVSAPNYWDTLTYHMPRVMHWAQQGAIWHTFTHNTRQLTMPPFSEFLILHLQLITGNDRLAALPQWFSMVNTLAIVILITRQFTDNRAARLFAAAAVVTIPSALLQSTSVQTDYVVTLWLAIFVCQVLEVARQDTPPDGWQVFRTGASLGLALLSKATAYLFALPFVIWFAVMVLRRNPRKGITTGALIAALALVINIGHYSRNLAWYGSPLGSNNEFTQSVNDRFGLDITFSNIIRNSTVHLGTSRALSRSITNAVITLHNVLGLDPHDPESTKYHLRFSVPPLSTYENIAGNPIHFLLGFVALTLLLARKELRQQRILVIYSLMLVAGFILFSGYLKWTEVRLRLQIPLFVLFTPLLGVVYSRFLRPFSLTILGVGLMLLVGPDLMVNRLRPLVMYDHLTTPRETQYFYELFDFQEIFEDAAAAIDETGCHQIGLVSGLESFEYPLWVLLKDMDQGYTITHIQPDRDIPDTPGGRASLAAMEDVCLNVYMKELASYKLVGDYKIEGRVIYSSLYLMVTDP